MDKVYKNNKIQLSIISPVYNEEQNIKLLYDKLKKVVGRLALSCEIIFINDGSNDQSSQVLAKIATTDKLFKVIEFRRNFGQTSAITAGIKNTSGDIIVLIDADLQNDPDDIVKLLSKINEGFDVVSGWRKDRKDAFFTRVLPSIIANKIISRIVGVNLHDYGCTLKAYKREIIKNITIYGEMHRLIPAYAAFEGAKITEVVVKHHPRKFGKSNYNLWRIVKLLFDLSTVKFLNDFSTKPLYLFGTFGLSIFALGFLVFLFVVVRVVFFAGSWISPMILLSGLMALLSIQFILIGLLAEILIRIYFESQGKTPFSIKRTINL